MRNKSEQSIYHLNKNKHHFIYVQNVTIVFAYTLLIHIQHSVMSRLDTQFHTAVLYEQI